MQKIILITLLFIAQFTFAQKIKVEKENNSVNNVSIGGFSIVIDLDKSTVRKEWQKQLKTYGKTSSNAEYTIVKTASVPSFATAGSSVYSKVTETINGVKIWCAILDTGKVAENTSKQSFDKAEKILHDFAATQYRDNINEQIKDAERALTLSSKNQESEYREAEKLKNQIKNNGEEKIALEQKLKDNAKELGELQKKQEQNKADQTKAAEDVERMKRAVEIVRAKLNEIN